MGSILKLSFGVVLAFVAASCSMNRPYVYDESYALYAVHEKGGLIEVHSVYRTEGTDLNEISDYFLSDLNELGLVTYQNMEFKILSNHQIPNIFLTQARFRFNTFEKFFQIHFISNDNFRYVSDYNDVINLVFYLPKNNQITHVFKAFRTAAHEAYHIAEIRNNLISYEKDPSHSEFLANLYSFCFTSAFMRDHQLNVLPTEFEERKVNHQEDYPSFDASTKGSIIFDSELVKRIGDNQFDTQSDDHISAVENWCQEYF